jgi:hypothetical protein
MAAKEALDQAEAALDAIEEKLDVLETPLAEIIEIKRNYGKIAALVLGGAVVGSAVTYFIANKRLSKKYEAQFNQELQDSVTFLVQQAGLDLTVSNDPDKDFPEEPSEEEAKEIVEELTRQSLAKKTSDPLPEVDGERVVPSQEDKPSLEDLALQNQKTRYSKMSSDLNYDEELSGSDEEIVIPEPTYQDPDISVISRDVFNANGTEWEQEQYIYFSDGGVMDAHGSIVVDQDDKIGVGAPAFGQMSDDPNVVYLRNKRLEREYEIVFDPSKASDFITASEGPEPEVSEDLMHSLASNINSKRLG